MSDNIVKEFIFMDEYDLLNMNKCEVKMTLGEEISDNKPVYNISYKYTYINEIGERKKAEEIIYPHPFADCKEDLCELKDGYLVFKNKITKTIVKFLLQDEEYLKKITGNSTPQYYRTQLILFLASLWE